MKTNDGEQVVHDVCVIKTVDQISCDADMRGVKNENSQYYRRLYRI